MKNQTNRILVSLLIVGFVLLGIGYSANKPLNGQNNSARSTLNKNFAEFQQTATAKCTSVTEGDILREINNSPESLKQQFRDGTITYSLTGKTLIFKGYIHGNGNNLRSLVGGFDKFRGERCLRVISFEGETTGSNFEWRPEPGTPTTPPPNGCDLGSVIERVVGNQLNNTLFYKYDMTSRILEFSGHIGDAPGRGKFNSLVAQLQRFMRNGCLAKIVFAPGTSIKGKTSAQLQKFTENGCTTKTAFEITKVSFIPKTEAAEIFLLGRGFEWQICEYPACECNGECRTCPC